MSDKKEKEITQSALGWSTIKHLTYERLQEGMLEWVTFKK